MLRLFYLLSMVALLVPPSGCAGNAQRLVDESTPADTKHKTDTAASLARSDKDHLANSNETDGSTNKPAADAKAAGDEQPANKPAAVAKRDHDRARPTRQATLESGTARNASAAHATESPSSSAQSDASDPLAAEVRAMDFDDPAEERSALAALRGAPAGAPRAFLLRMLKASLDSRQQNSSQRLAASNGPPSFGQDANRVHDAAGSQAAVFERAAGRTKDRAAGSVHLASVQQADDLPKSVRANQRYVDPNAVAVIEVERAAELPTLDKRQTPVGAVAVRTVPDEPAGDWQGHVERAISGLEEAHRAAQTDRATLEAKLRLLQLVADRRDEALRSRAGASTAEQEFWAKELYGLATLLDYQRQPNASQRAAVAVEHLRQAAERLGEIGGLVVKNVRFCTEVKGYGTFITLPQDEFRLGQEVLLYCEVENFQSKLGDRGYHTALKARYQIFDAGGNSVAEKDLGLKEEHCQNRRRDFFIPYFLWMPKQVPAGKYKLKLTVEDIHAAQTGEATIEFAIKEK